MFNALCENGKAQAANFPFCTIEPNVGIVAVPDERLEALRCGACCFRVPARACYRARAAALRRGGGSEGVGLQVEAAAAGAANAGSGGGA